MKIKLNTENGINKKENEHYLSLDEWIIRMKLAFSNGKLPKIQSKLALVGYNSSRLDKLLQQTAQLETLHQKQKKEHVKQCEKSVKVDKKRKKIDTYYKNHLALCRILFKNNVKAIEVLEFNGKRKVTFGGWCLQVSNFYSQLLQNTDLLKEVKAIGIQNKELESVQTLLSELMTLKKKQKKETEEAQKATEIRNAAFENLYLSYTELIVYAKVVLNREQNPEASGKMLRKRHMRNVKLKNTPYRKSALLE